MIPSPSRVILSCLAENFAFVVKGVADEHGIRKFDLAPAEAGDRLVTDVGDAHSVDDPRRQPGIYQTLAELHLTTLFAVEV